MLKSIEGIYRDGKIELSEIPSDIDGEIRVIVTFLNSSPINLQDRNIDQEQAADLRASLATFAEDWDSPEMDNYNNYDAAYFEMAQDEENEAEALAWIEATLEDMLAEVNQENIHEETDTGPAVGKEIW